MGKPTDGTPRKKPPAPSARKRTAAAGRRNAVKPEGGAAGMAANAKADVKSRGEEGKHGKTKAPGPEAQIAAQIYIAMERLGADAELLAIVGSWRDTLSDEKIVALLRDYNATGKVLRPLKRGRN